MRYVGISKHDTPEQRFVGHLRSARGKSHLPVHSWIRRHVADGHTISPVAFRTHITRDEACRLEHDLVVGLRDTGRLLNLTDGGDGNVGWKHSEESRARISVAQKGRPVAAETRAKISAAQKGKPRPAVTAETGAKISAALKGKPRRPFTAETRTKMSAAKRNLSSDTRAKMSAAQTGRIITSETRAKISAALKGRSLSPETRSRMSAAQKSRYRGVQS